jgi:transcriptional regulator GlxA family with amidase domain
MRGVQPEKQPMVATAPETPPFGSLRVGFVLADDFGMLGFASALDTLRYANRISGRPLYSWNVYSADGGSVRSSAGVRIEVDGCVDDAVGSGLVLVVAGVNAERYRNEGMWEALRRLARRGAVLGGVSLGPYLLARAGLLNGYRCTVHWENLAAFSEEFPRIRVSAEVFEVDRDRVTCSGGTAALDLMLEMMGSRHGTELASQVADACVLDRIRTRGDSQRMPLRLRLGVSHPKLLRAIELIERSQEQRTSQRQLAGGVGLSERQLERLFRRYLDTTPSRYARDHRLARARDLLRQTGMSVIEVAVACGFATASHFTKSYRERFGKSPGEDRGANAA